MADHRWFDLPMPTSRRPDGSDGHEADPIELAHEAPFALGGVAVTLAALSLATGAWTQRLEPRVMQLLVVLAQASPAVVGRAELNTRVWGGRIVGEDAINRAVQTLRRITMEIPPAAPFSVETVPRVGYRLTIKPAVASGQAALVNGAIESSASRDTGLPAAASRPPLASWLSLRALCVMGLALAAAIGVTLFHREADVRQRPPGTWRIAGSAPLDDLPPGVSDVVLSPDGRHIAYRGHHAAGHERIYVRAADDKGAGQPVSPEATDALHPAWSRDSTYLAFVGYDPGLACRLFVARPNKPASAVSTCETARDPHLAWSADSRSLLIGDAPGWNAVSRVTSIDIGDSRRTVLSSPPGDSMGDDLPMPLGEGIVFRRQFAFGNEGWILRNISTGQERTLWQRPGVIDSVAATLPGSALVVAWTRSGHTALDFIDADGRVTSQPIGPAPVTALSSAGLRLVIETDHAESALVRAASTAAAATTLVTVRGRIRLPMLLPDGRIRFPVRSGNMARMWEYGPGGSLRPWGTFVASTLAGPALSPDGRMTAASATVNAGREVVLFDERARVVYRWNPHARSSNPPAWRTDGRHLLVPVLDAAGWRLFEIDPFKGSPPRDIGLPGFATVVNRGAELYAVRAGETTSSRELWRLDGRARRLPIDVTLLDIMNWRVAEDGIWLTDRSDRNHPRLVRRDVDDGQLLSSLAAPGLGGASTGIVTDPGGPIYVKAVRDETETSILVLASAP